MSDENSLLRWGYLVLAGAGGAIASLSVRAWQNMTRSQIVVSAVSAMSFSLFLGPWVAESWFKLESTNIRAFGVVVWLMAAASHILTPIVIKRVEGFGSTVDPTKPPEVKP